MFRSATLKLTAWYAGILMLISLGFSLIIFQISSSEIDNRLTRFQGLIQSSLTNPLDEERWRLNEALNGSWSLAIQLIYLNIGVLVIGTTASYFLARRTLKPVEEAHEAEMRFVSDASHELRTPLAIMKSEIEMTLRDPNSTKQELREILQSNLEEVNNLSAMSETLLKMAKLDSDVPMKPIRIKPLVIDVCQRFKQPTTRLQLINTDGALVNANRQLLAEALVIIIDNALKYSPETSTVKVSTKLTANEIAISVENEGEGIKPEDLEHVFDRFYRADPSRTTHQNKKGFGLGLSLAKQISMLHGGYITASSAPKENTIFTIFLPRNT